MKRSSRWVGAAVILAVAVRLLHDAAMSATPFFAHPGLDAQWHIEWARLILAGREPASPWFRAPGYAYVLAFVFRLFGAGPWPIHVVQALLGGVTTWLVHRLARCYFDRGVAVTAAFAAALCGPLVYFDGELLAPAVAIPLFLTALIAAARARTGRDWLIAGIAFGAGALVLPTVLAVVVAFSLLLVRPGLAPRSAAGRAAVPLLFLGTALALAPAVLRNGIVAGDWTLATSGGVNFYAGNHPGATGLSIVLPEFPTQPGWRVFVAETESLAVHEAGRPLRPSQVSTFYARKGLGFWRHHPVDAAGLELRKIGFLLNGHAHPNNRDLYRVRHDSPVLAALLWHAGPFHFPLGLVLPLAALAVFGAAGRRAGLLVLYLAAYGFAVTLFFVTERYRLPLVPVLLILAAAGADRLARERLRFDAGLVAGFIILVIANTHAFGAGASNPMQEDLRRGEAWFDAGDYTRASDAFRAAAGAWPRSPEPLVRLGGALQAAGRGGEAADAWEKAARLGSRDAVLWFNLGAARLAENRPADAADALETAVRLDPSNANAWTNLAVARSATGNEAGASAAFDRALALDPGNPVALAEEGRRLAVSGDREAARRVWTRALARDSTSVELRFNLGLLAFDDGRLDEAARSFRDVIAIAPDNGAAWFQTARIAAVRSDTAAVVDGLDRARALGFPVARAVAADPASEGWRGRPELAPFRGGDGSGPR